MERMKTKSGKKAGGRVNGAERKKKLKRINDDDG